MKVALILFPLLFFFLVPLYPVYAKNTTDSTDSAAARMTKKEQLKEKIQERKDLFETRITKFKDKKKASTVERVNNHFANLNSKLTDVILGHLERLTAILDKAEARLTRLASNNDTTNARDSINKARAAIAAAESGVQNQAQMDYTIQISSESGAKADAKVQRDKLHADLKGARDLVRSAKDAVIVAIRAINNAISKGVNGN